MLAVPTSASALTSIVPLASQTPRATAIGYTPGVALLDDTYPFHLGAYSRPISTTSAEAQRWFDLGLLWCFGFNHEEGVKCFQRALTNDPDCVMAHWGIAYGSGPFYNLVWR